MEEKEITEIREIREEEEVGETEDENIEKMKVILVGETGVGKTCIIYRLINDTFNDNTLSTITMSSEEKTITLKDEKNTKIKLQVWDTCGQEKYRNLVKLFFQDAKSAILVYDSTSRRSFDDLKNYWYDKVKESASEDTNK